MSEERDDIIVMVDEDGNEEEFEFLDTIEMNERKYVVLMPYNEEQGEEDTEEEEVVILKIVHENEEDTFVNIEDEEELNSVFEEFKYRMQEDDNYN